MKKDPTFAPAYVGLAAAFTELGTVFIGASPVETRPKVISFARKALELDPDLSDAHVLLTDVLQCSSGPMPTPAVAAMLFASSRN